MTNKSKKWKEEYETIKAELLMEQVSDAMNKTPKNWRYNLEELGFVWVDDDDHQEEQEERKATPHNKNQENLVVYFKGETELRLGLIKTFIEEVESDDPNYPLFRKYFKSRNKRLLQLLLSGLSTMPTNLILLSGIDYYHECNGILSEVINVYLNACKACEDNEVFKEIAINFIEITAMQEYDALEELKIIYKTQNDKLKILLELENILSQSEEYIHF